MIKNNKLVTGVKNWLEDSDDWYCEKPIYETILYAICGLIYVLLWVVLVILLFLTIWLWGIPYGLYLLTRKDDKYV